MPILIATGGCLYRAVRESERVASQPSEDEDHVHVAAYSASDYTSVPDFIIVS